MTSALLVIDVQNVYEFEASPLCVPGSAAALANINALIAAFAAKGKPVIYVRHVHRADGRDAGRMFDFAGTQEPLGFVEGTAEAEYVPGLSLIPEGLHITKHRYSAFEGTELETLLRSLGANRVVICGYMTNFCCETTARVAHDKDYFVDFISDATGAPDLGPEFTQEKIVASTCASLSAGFSRVFSTLAYMTEI